MGSNGFACASVAKHGIEKIYGYNCKLYLKNNDTTSYTKELEEVTKRFGIVVHHDRKTNTMLFEVVVVSDENAKEKHPSTRPLNPKVFELAFNSLFSSEEDNHLLRWKEDSGEIKGFVKNQNGHTYLKAVFQKPVNDSIGGVTKCQLWRMLSADTGNFNDFCSLDQTVAIDSLLLLWDLNYSNFNNLVDVGLTYNAIRDFESLKNEVDYYKDAIDDWLYENEELSKERKKLSEELNKILEDEANALNKLESNFGITLD